MIYIKPLTILLLISLLSTMVTAQIPTAIESNTTSLIPSTTEILNSSSSTIIASTTPITTSSATSSLTTSIASSPTKTPSQPFTPITTSSSAINALPTVQPTGWDSNGNVDNGNQQSWLRQHNRFVFVIVLGLLFLAVLIWYIVRSIKGMRKRLEHENEAQLYMMQQATNPQPPRNDRVIPELTQTPPPQYKSEEHPSVPH